MTGASKPNAAQRDKATKLLSYFLLVAIPQGQRVVVKFWNPLARALIFKPNSATTYTIVGGPRGLVVYNTLAMQWARDSVMARHGIGYPHWNARPNSRDTPVATFSRGTMPQAVHAAVQFMSKNGRMFPIDIRVGTERVYGNVPRNVKFRPNTQSAAKVIQAAFRRTRAARSQSQPRPPSPGPNEVWAGAVTKKYRNWRHYFGNELFGQGAFTSSPNDINRVYKARALQTHPDKNPSRQALATEAFKQLRKFKTQYNQSRVIPGRR